MSIKSSLKNIFEKKYKLLLIIPFLLLILAMVQIGVQTATTGDFVQKGISLSGGSTITIIRADIDSVDLQNHLMSEFPKADLSVRKLVQTGQQTGITIESDAQTQPEVDSLVKAIKQYKEINEDEINIEVVGAALGSSFFKETFIAIAIAFVCMGLVVFLYFRDLIPSLAVILAAFSDIIITLAIFNLLGFKLSTAGIAAFLMLIGYSVDTDILLSTRVLKRKEGSLMDRVYGAMKTGLTMSITTLVAVTVGLFVAQSPVLKQIMTILVIGLLVDIISTWLQNAGLLRWHLTKKKNGQI